jgi:HEPN domain-containing protein
MIFEPRHYYRAALERIEQARELYRQDHRVNHHTLAFYAAGLAVECMLRAFLTRHSREFEGRHDLIKLFEESGILDLDPSSPGLSKLSDEELESIKKDLGVAVARVNRLWRNNVRFASGSYLKSYLHELGLDRGIKGDVVKENLRRLLEACNLILNRGVILWEASPTSPNE